MSELVLTEKDGDILVVTLNRPEKRNAITIEFLHAIADGVATADKHDVRAVIVNANGPTFSAGIDIMSIMMQRGELGDLNMSRWLRRMAEDLQHALFKIEQTEVPVIGALHGKVLGLGLELAMAFDFRVATPDVQLALPETGLGLIADVGGTTRLTKLVGPSRAKDLLMTCRTVGADEALSWGLLNRVGSGQDPVVAAKALAADIAKNAPLAVGLAKYVVDNGDGVDRQTQMAIERLAQSQLIASQDVMEAMAAFMEKRPPAWKGA